MALAGSNSGAAMTLTAPYATAVAERESINTPRSLCIFFFFLVPAAGSIGQPVSCPDPGEHVSSIIAGSSPNANSPARRGDARVNQRVIM